MPSRRDIIRMSEAEIGEYLRSRNRIILVTIGPEGMPHPVPMNYGLDDAGRIIITAFRKSQKVRNLERDPRAGLLVESGDSYAELKSVMAYADAEIIREPEAVIAAMGHIAADKKLAGSISGAMSDQVRDSISKRVALRFTPSRYVSWDHGKLEGFY